MAKPRHRLWLPAWLRNRLYRSQYRPFFRPLCRIPLHFWDTGNRGPDYCVRCGTSRW